MNTEITLLLVLLAGVVAGAIISWLIQTPKLKGLHQVLENNNRELEQLRSSLQATQEERNQLNGAYMAKEALYRQSTQALEQAKQLLQENAQQYNKLNEEKTGLYEKLKFTREKLDNQQNDILRLREQFRLEFTEIAHKILDDNTKKFTERNEVQIKQILEPLKLNIQEFKQKVEDTYDRESKERFSLGREVQRLIEMSQQVSQEANNLTTALKGNNKMQGNWGEMILESLLENSGLSKGREYRLQEFIRDESGNIVKDENGRGLQPDVTIYYPDDRKIIIDSKVSLVSWEQCVGCDDKETQRAYLVDHIRSMRQHIDGLSRKNYPKYAAALDYVILFVPVEPAFLEAVKSDPMLWKYAYEKRILLVSPTNLFSVLKIIADLWKVEQQNRNAIHIAEKAGALYDKFHSFLENLEGVGKKLDDATQCYAEALKQLTTGRGNIIGRIEELKRMGAKANKQLPSRLTNESDEQGGE
ncbi:DNA recombination protein RmuC [Segetibacter sp. 3557_3]|uniref:DNA recombination protein RmuC n=1 Tax=Segetibacter sp. 3557_3 TaxID=2547429 RepID=UPI0010585F94|nr:DNA recombination protein RmuC [Segetibacter sp. 3557_3]TDH27352.1 DNA recombination protein RmuC [Segetibacter sp. 3557_3]